VWHSACCSLLAIPPHCYSTSIVPTLRLSFHVPTPRLLLLFFKVPLVPPCYCPPPPPLLRPYSPWLLPTCLLLFLAYVSPNGIPFPSFSLQVVFGTTTNKQGEFFLEVFFTFYLIIFKSFFFQFLKFLYNVTQIIYLLILGKKKRQEIVSNL
jgi:hypothetical protein